MRTNILLSNGITFILLIMTVCLYYHTPSTLALVLFYEAVDVKGAVRSGEEVMGSAWHDVIFVT